MIYARQEALPRASKAGISPDSASSKLGINRMYPA
jgi:hypothetical protein